MKLNAADMFQSNLNGWRQKLRQNVRLLTPEQLNWVPSGGVNSVAWCLRHLAQSEDWWVRAVILGETMVPKRTKELLDPQALFAYLDTVWQKTDACMVQWDWEYLQQPRPMPAGFMGEPPEQMTVLWALNQLQQHFAFHAGQIRMLVRMQGLEPDTAS